MFMIFGNHAVNFDLVTLLEEMPGPGSRVNICMVRGNLIVCDVTIDQILTAQAVGQSRVPAELSVRDVMQARRTQDDASEYLPITGVERALGELWHFDDGSKRGLSTGNDPQAMNSIGRK